MEFNSRKRLNLEFETLLETNNPEFRSIFFFIRRSLKQFRLDNYYNVIDVLTETYIRAINYVENQQEDIKNLQAWIRVTAYNVVREFSREQQRYQSLDKYRETQHSLELAKIPNSLAIENDIEPKIIILQSALQNLEDDERKIIEMRFLEGLSWSEIAKRLESEEGKVINIAALRKRGSRSLQRLRQIYTSQSSELD
jgi:RNA polymerase sigma factor (sigma-70 family)